MNPNKQTVLSGIYQFSLFLSVWFGISMTRKSCFDLIGVISNICLISISGYRTTNHRMQSQNSTTKPSECVLQVTSVLFIEETVTSRATSWEEVALEVTVCCVQIFAGFSGQGNSIPNIISLLKKKVYI